MLTPSLVALLVFVPPVGLFVWWSRSRPAGSTSRARRSYQNPSRPHSAEVAAATPDGAGAGAAATTFAHHALNL